MHLHELIRVYDNILSSEECNVVIQEFNKQREFEFHDTELFKFKQLNVNKHVPHLASAFVKHCCLYVNDYFKSLGFDEYIGIQGFEEVKIKKYEKNSNCRFDPHVDSLVKENCLRYLVFILYLNDNNGYTSFPNLKFKFKPKQGSLIIFPPFWMFPHAGEVSTDNDKYVMMSYLHHT